MSLTTAIANLLFTRRRGTIEDAINDPWTTQYGQLKHLVSKGEETLYGKKHGLRSDHGYEDFRKLPVTDYESLQPYIERALGGERSVLWPGEVKWFAKSSGTTGSKSKFIPVTNDGLKDCHMQGPKDILSFYLNENPESKLFQGKSLTLGGSKKVERSGNVQIGDLSAILLENTPDIANLLRVPSVDTALIPDFEQKVLKICEETIDQNVVSFAGVPSWNLVMMNKILEYSGSDNLLQIWPNLELFIHGGMSFKPYAEQYRRLIPTDRMNYLETYNASEGFFSLADRCNSEEMLLMLDYKIFYEFIPAGKFSDGHAAVPLEGVSTGVNYAMLITSSNGLWRYMLGDTVEFTSTNPYRIRITGRTKHYVNAFGEEIIIDNAENAINSACEKNDAVVSEYTMAPVFMDGRHKGAHEWVVEFSKPPWDIEKFRNDLDISLQALNSDYEAKRFKDTTLEKPVITVVGRGTFHQWMKDNGKIGGQNKVPRLYNDRRYVDQLKEVALENA